MKKHLIAIGIGALLLTSGIPIECMGSSQPDDTSYEEISFTFLQDVLRNNNCQAGIAFLGYIEDNVSSQDILNYTKQDNYLESYPFLQNATIVDAGGYEVYAIVPACDWSICVYPSEITEEAEYKDYLESPLYEGIPNEVILLRCNISEIYSNVMVTSSENNMIVTYRPSISLENGYLAEEQRCYDFSFYNEENSKTCMEPNLPEDFNDSNVQDAYEVLCATDEVSYYLGYGFCVMYTGNKEVIHGRECMIFVLGKEHEDHFETKSHYAVCNNQVYYLDVLEDTWNILGAG